jgi:hypothetical protein
MASNHERPDFKEITVNEERIELSLIQFNRARRYSSVLRDSRTSRFDIPPEDSAANNFDKTTIIMFFEGFQSEDHTWTNPGLDCESLVGLCHVFWWLRCDTRALRSSRAFELLKPSIQTDRWNATGSRCANRLAVSLVLGWEDQLTASCNELVHKTTDNDDNLLHGLPSADCKCCEKWCALANLIAERNRVQNNVRDQIILKIWDSLPGSADKFRERLSKKPDMRYLQHDQNVFEISPEEMVTRLLAFISPAQMQSSPGSTAVTPQPGWGRRKSAGAVLVHNAFEAGSRWLSKNRDVTQGESKLSGELEKLKTSMKANNDYRDACIRDLRAKGGHWRG